jgi:hypothetical protein
MEKKKRREEKKEEEEEEEEGKISYLVPKMSQRKPSTTNPPITCETMESVFLLRKSPASKNARAGIIPRTRIVETRTHVVSPGSMQSESNILFVCGNSM